MSRSLTDAVDRLRTTPSSKKTASYGGSALRALAATVRAAPLRPVTASDFHAVNQTNWSKVSEERARFVEKVAANHTPLATASAAVMVASFDDLAERRDKLAAAGVVSRALTLLHRGST